MGIKRRLFLSMAAVLPFASARGEDTVTAKMVKIHFLHHSTGLNLINGAGGIGKMFQQYNLTNGTDYRFTEEWSLPSEDNYPYHYYTQTFAPEQLKKYAGEYQVVIWKHCFPGSSMFPDEVEPSVDSSRKTPGVYKLQYRALRDRFDAHPGTKFMVWTLPPLHRLATNPNSARLATEFSAWVKTEFLTENGPRPNLGCFDFRSHVVGDDNFLRPEYELDHENNDSHPNQLANDTVCPLFFNAVIDFVKEQQISVENRPPLGFRLGPASPNPFNPATAIEYQVPAECHVILTIHDALGRTVAVLQDGRIAAGVHRTIWNGKDLRGNPAASGTYLYSLRAGAYRGQGKMTLLR